LFSNIEVIASNLLYLLLNITFKFIVFFIAVGLQEALTQEKRLEQQADKIKALCE